MSKPVCMVCKKECDNLWHVVGECNDCEGKTKEILERLEDCLNIRLDDRKKYSGKSPELELLYYIKTGKIMKEVE
jgi:hypothetical protein